MTHRAPGLYLDEDVSVILAAILRARGFDVVTTRDAGRLGHADVDQLAYAAEPAGCSSLTIDRTSSDFTGTGYQPDGYTPESSWLGVGRLARSRPG